jgi:archaellum component FlaC|tara:strand:+ start:756 stop:932 length:177 start_codon:yes stop_codon:yes gene_type:complete
MSKEIEELKKQIDQIEKTVYRIEQDTIQIKKDLKEHIGEIWDIYKKLKKVITVSSFFK